MQRHQSNYAHILSLRQTSAALDEQLRQNIQLLADIRRDIKGVPAHVERSNVPGIPVNDLLSYARFISKTSVPPTQQEEISQANNTINAQATQADSVNGSAPAGQADAEPRPVKTESVSLRAVDEQTKRALDPLKDLLFEPWPTYAVIQQGALADIQRMVDAGQDPAAVLSADEQAEVNRRKEEAEEKDKHLEEQRREMRRASTFTGPGSRPIAQAQNDVFDPDEV